VLSNYNNNISISMHINPIASIRMGRAWIGTARRRAGVLWAVLGLDNRLVVPARHGTICRSWLKI